MTKKEGSPVKILGLEMENVKRVSLVRLAPSPEGLTVIGGDNAQGKTSVLDGIVYALGGEKYRPSTLQHEGGMAPARIRIELSNGLVVERRGKNAALKVTDPTGKRAGQRLLDDLIDELALNLPRFLHGRDDDRLKTVLRTLGIEDKLAQLALAERAAYDKRHDMGVVVDQKRKYAAELAEYPDAPEMPVSAADLIAKSGEIIQRNADRARARKERGELSAKLSRLADEAGALKLKLAAIEADMDKVTEALTLANATPITPDESTADLEAKIQHIEEVNARVRANADKARALADAEEYEARLAPLTAEVERIRKERTDLLEGAAMPLPDLTVWGDGKAELRYKGQPWDCMSSMEQIRVATAIIRRIKPGCGFILIDGMEAFDPKQMAAFDTWLREEGLQAITTRVGKEGASIIIEDGYAVQEGVEPALPVPDQNAPIPMEGIDDRRDTKKEDMAW